MFRGLCNSDSKTAPGSRIATFQMVIYSAFIVLYVIAFSFTDDIKRKDNTVALISHIFLLLAIFNVFPLLLAFILFTAIAKKNYKLVRAYIIMKIFEVVVNNVILLALCLYCAIQIELYIILLLCELPIIITVSMLEWVVQINGFYKSMKGETASERRKQNLAAV